MSMPPSGSFIIVSAFLLGLLIFTNTFFIRLFLCAIVCVCVLGQIHLKFNADTIDELNLKNACAHEDQDFPEYPSNNTVKCIESNGCVYHELPKLVHTMRYNAHRTTMMAVLFTMSSSELINKQWVCTAFFSHQWTKEVEWDRMQWPRHPHEQINATIERAGYT